MIPEAAAADRRPWVRTAVVVGVLYALVGILFALPAAHALAWRREAWVVSALAYAAHIAHEQFRLRSPPRAAALHVAAAVALGAFGLALGANIHSLSSESSGSHRRLLLLALALWPLMAALPAFLVALGIHAGLTRAVRSPGAGPG